MTELQLNRFTTSIMHILSENALEKKKQNKSFLPSVINLANSTSAPRCFLAFLPGPLFTLLVGSNFRPMTSIHLKNQGLEKT